MAEIQLYAALALLHDAGKRAIPPEILNKHGSPTCEEFEVMKSHTAQGCDLLWSGYRGCGSARRFPPSAMCDATTMSIGTAAEHVKPKALKGKVAGG